VRASSNEGDIILDPFCGCGTAIAVAQKLNRRWIGIDITCLATGLIKHRLATAFGKVDFAVVGEPEALHEAQELAENDKFQFQCWALSLVKVPKVESKKGADKGIDGRIAIEDEHEGRKKIKHIIFSVKGGKNLTSSHVRDLRGVIEREDAAIGVLISLFEPTRDMRKEAASAGFYESIDGSKYPRIQLLTIEEMLAGKTYDAPRWAKSYSFKAAPKAKRKKEHRQKDFFEE